MVHENFRFRPWYREIRNQLASGIIGKPYYCRSDGRMPGTVTTKDHPITPFSLNRQAFFTDLERFLILESVIHQIDVCRYLFGDVNRVYARARRVSPHVKGEDLATLVLDFDGLHAVVERNYGARGQPAPPMVTELMVIEGELGALFVELDGTIRIEIDTPERRETLRPNVDLLDAYPRSYGAAIRHFVENYRAGTPFETDIADNLKTLAVTLAAYDSVETGDAVGLDA
jgi:predicted dehydrogenase